jgi:C1A family cysteine protease
MSEPHHVKGYGWKPDLPDARDKMLRVGPPIALPPRVSHRSVLPPCYDQGQLGSCTGNAIAGAIQHNRIKQRLPDFQSRIPSRLFVYFNERVIERSVPQDNGAMIRDGIKSIAKEGVCFEDLWPYDISKFTVRPTPDCYQAALKTRAVQYSRVPQTEQQMKQTLALGFCIIMGFTCYESFESEQVAKSGILNIPKPGESVVGGHAILVTGYDEETRRFEVRNSWGSNWGMGGYFTTPYEYYTNRQLADDLWVVQLVSSF